MGLLNWLSSHTRRRTLVPPLSPMIHQQPRFAVLDVETTGLSPQTNRIVEIAIVTTDPWGRVLDEWSTRLNPEGPVGATHIHGITDADVARAPRFSDILDPLRERLSGAAVAAHNAAFDMAFLRAEYTRLGWRLPAIPTLCTLEASTAHLPHLDRRRLVDCCSATGIRLAAAHSALGDARATANLLAAFLHPHHGAPPSQRDLGLPHQALQVPWPDRPSGSPIVSSVPAPHQHQRTQTVRRRTTTARPTARHRTALLDRFSLTDALDEGAPAGSLGYLEKLSEVLDDGLMSADEAAALGSLAASAGWTTNEVAEAHRAFIQALAHEALEDGKVSRDERRELTHLADLLDVRPTLVRQLLDRAERARHARLSAGLPGLPTNWRHGEPLRVGDKVVFTGCDDYDRPGLERRAEDLGVRVLGAVSSKVKMLVSDGSMDGTKAAKARELSTRVVHPHEFAILLAHLQPARETTPSPLPALKDPRPQQLPLP